MHISVIFICKHLTSKTPFCNLGQTAIQGEPLYRCVFTLGLRAHHTVNALTNNSPLYLMVKMW